LNHARSLRDENGNRCSLAAEPDLEGHVKPAPHGLPAAWMARAMNICFKRFDDVAHSRVDGLALYNGKTFSPLRKWSGARRRGNV